MLIKEGSLYIKPDFQRDIHLERLSLNALKPWRSNLNTQNFECLKIVNLIPIVILRNFGSFSINSIVYNSPLSSKNIYSRCSNYANPDIDWMKSYFYSREGISRMDLIFGQASVITLTDILKLVILRAMWVTPSWIGNEGDRGQREESYYLINQ